MYGTVLVALDGSTLAERAIRYAEDLTAPRGRLLLARVIEPTRLAPSSGSADFATLRDAQRLTAHLRRVLERPRVEAAAYLDGCRKKIARTDLAVETRVLEGSPVDRLVEAAGEADLVVLTAHGRTGLRRLVLGTVAERVIQQSPVPVLVVRDRPGDAESSGSHLTGSAGRTGGGRWFVGGTAVAEVMAPATDLLGRWARC
ncbi:MAG TPA: universal stress protein [Thermodesulfobacteriota bacterium]